MTLHQWLGLACTLAIIGFVVFAFRKGKSVKPDKNRRTEDWPNITQGGSS
jgi:hypothetical protein